MTRKLTLSTFDFRDAETVGVDLIDAAIQLGLWDKHLDSVTLEEKFVLWLNRDNYRLSTIHLRHGKIRRIYKKGYTIKDQINTIITTLAGEGNEDFKVTAKEIAKHLDLGPVVKGEDLHRTIYHNIDFERLPAGSTNYWTQYLSRDSVAKSYWPPALSSEDHNIFKSRFNRETDGQD